MLGFEAADAVFAAGIDVDHPESGSDAGRHSDIAVGDAPIAFDGFRICGRGIEAARDGRGLTADDEWENRERSSAVGERVREVVHDPPPPFARTGEAGRTTKPVPLALTSSAAASPIERTRRQRTSPR